MRKQAQNERFKYLKNKYIYCGKAKNQELYKAKFKGVITIKDAKDRNQFYQLVKYYSSLHYEDLKTLRDVIGKKDIMCNNALSIAMSQSDTETEEMLKKVLGMNINNINDIPLKSGKCLEDIGCIDEDD